MSFLLRIKSRIFLSIAGSERSQKCHNKGEHQEGQQEENKVVHKEDHQWGQGLQRDINQDISGYFKREIKWDLKSNFKEDIGSANKKKIAINK